MKKTCFLFASVLVVSFLIPIQAIGEDKIVTQATLLDRIQIEDMLIRYYVDLTLGKSHDLAQYFTKDAVLDLRGINSRKNIYKGRDEIKTHFEEPDEIVEENPSGNVHVLLNNPIINVDGDTATVWAIWTTVMNDDIQKPPRLIEQGREYSKLVKINSRWYIKKRYITSDSGMSETVANKYTPRKFR